jgi:organic radical activating enzyme
MAEQSTKVAAYPLMEDFYTIQGEGFHQGKAAYFIRLGGCDVGCVWCDVKESWDASRHPVVSAENIAHRASGSGAPIAVITGGEPTMYDLQKLTERLQASNMHTHVETSGVYGITGLWDWICLSPKKFREPLPENLQRADELKVIVYHKSDLDWAQEFRDRIRPDCRLYLQPEWSRRDAMLPTIVDFVKRNPEWEISLQIHKYMNIP